MSTRRLKDHSSDTSHHPLDPLTIQELNVAHTILNSYALFTSTSSYALHSVKLQEPDKSLILKWKHGDPLFPKRPLSSHVSTTKFHLKPDARAGVIVSRAKVWDPDTRELRDVMYKGFTSELFVPYMDPTDAWYFKTYMDADEYGFGLQAMPLEPLNDYSRNTYYMDGVFVAADGKSYVRSNMVCIFESYTGDIGWRHTKCPIMGMEGSEKVTLVVRMAASVANYDYIVDWEFQTDGLIRVKVGLSGILMVKGTSYENMEAF
ncbi:hypothetical protein FF1_037869 [Malus domestica]